MKNKCCICEHTIVNPKEEVYLGQDKYRHDGCKAGSSRWMQTRGKNSDIAPCFKQPNDSTKKSKKVKHVQHKNIKAFAGRVRYLMFMHERDCKDPEYQSINWTITGLNNCLQAYFQDGLTIEFDGKLIDFEPRDSLTERIEKLI